MNGASESECAKAILLEGLENWIRLLKLPAGGNYYVHKLEDVVAQIANDARRIKPLLLTRDTWGGMGSFLDSAVPHYESAIPDSTEAADRARQWENTHRELDRWHREFSAVTIQVGTSLVDWCRANGGIESDSERRIDNWIEGARIYLKEPYRALKPENIECLENNMRWIQPTEPGAAPNERQ